MTKLLCDQRLHKGTVEKTTSHLFRQMSKSGSVCVSVTDPSTASTMMLDLISKVYFYNAYLNRSGIECYIWCVPLGAMSILDYSCCHLPWPELDMFKHTVTRDEMESERYSETVDGWQYQSDSPSTKISQKLLDRLLWNFVSLALWFSVKYLHNYWMDCRGISYRHSGSQEDKF